LRKFALGVVLLASAGPAFAADMATKMPVKAPPMSAAAPTWSGCYAGLDAGGAWGRSNITSVDVVTATGLPVAAPNNVFLSQLDSPKLHPSGFSGGAEAGCNWQSGNLVAGVEADLGYMGLRGSQTGAGTYPVGGGALTTSNSVKTDWLFTARPRLGYASNNWLAYVTGGLAVTDIKYTESFSDAAGDSENAGVTKTKAGWVVGGGIEYALQRNWTAKIEYLHADFGNVSTMGLIFTGGVPIGQSLTHNVPLSADIVRLGLNYQFH
jgi:outer membrane immunogenic protein